MIAVLILVGGGVGIKLYDRMLLPLFKKLALSLGIEITLLKPAAQVVGDVLDKLTPGLVLAEPTTGAVVLHWPHGTCGVFRDPYPDISKPDTDPGLAEWICVHRKRLSEGEQPWLALDDEDRIDRWLRPLHTVKQVWRLCLLPGTRPWHSPWRS